MTTEDLEAGTRRPTARAARPPSRRRCPASRTPGLARRARSRSTPPSIYARFRSVGLEYGPEYRTLTSARVSRDAGVAVGQLRRRSRKEGTRVHPADLDGSLHLTALLAEATAAGEIRLPFSVGEAALADVSGAAWPVAERQGASWRACGWCGRQGGQGLARRAPDRLRDARAQGGAAAAPARKPTHLYVTSWQARRCRRRGAQAALVMRASPPPARVGSGAAAAASDGADRLGGATPSASPAAPSPPTRSPVSRLPLTSRERTPWPRIDAGVDAHGRRPRRPLDGSRRLEPRRADGPGPPGALRGAAVAPADHRPGRAPAGHDRAGCGVEAGRQARPRLQRHSRARGGL